MLSEADATIAELAPRLACSAVEVFLYPTSLVTPQSLHNLKGGGWAPELAACSGWPALTVPAGRAADGVPVGMELLARAGCEKLLFRCGLAIERGMGSRPRPRF